MYKCSSYIVNIRTHDCINSLFMHAWQVYIYKYMYFGNLVIYNYMIVFSLDTGQYRGYSCVV